MLTPEQIAALRDAAEKVAEPITNFLLDDIARRVAGAGQLTSTAAYQVWRAQQLGLSRRAIKKRLQELLGKSDTEINKLLTQAAEVGYRFDLDRIPTSEAIPFEQNTAVQQIVSAAVKLAQDDFTNLTQTLGMVGPDGAAYPLQAAYRKCMDYAFEQVFTGAADYNTAIRQATKNLANMGVRTIDYESGVHTSIEAATRRNIMGGLGLMQEQIAQANHDELGCDGWEISAHAASAPDHEPIQGKQYSDAEYTALNGSLVRRIGTLNCGHSAFPIILGVNSPQHTPEQLRRLREDNEKGVVYEGRRYTMYEATQQQRKLERAIRRQKSRILVDEATGDANKLTTDRIKLQRLNQEYARFSKATGLPTQRERAQVAGFGRGQAARAAKAVEIAPKRATIESSTGKGGSDVHYVTRLDVEKYRCVTEQITTDEVIITGERIQHIKERHPRDFERYEGYLAKIIEAPDFILESDMPHTAFLLKEIQEEAEHFQLILRLKVVGDPEDYKNSIITFLKVSEKKWNKYLRNKKILYKRE